MGDLLQCLFRVTRSHKLQLLLRKMKVPQVHKGRNKLRERKRKNKIKRCM